MEVFGQKYLPNQGATISKTHSINGLCAQVAAPAGLMIPIALGCGLVLIGGGSLGCSIAERRREAKYNEVNEKRAEKGRRDREAKKAAAELPTGSKAPSKRGRDNVTESAAAGTRAASKKKDPSKDGKTVKVAHKSGAEKRSGKVAPGAALSLSHPWFSCKADKCLWCSAQWPR